MKLLSIIAHRTSRIATQRPSRFLLHHWGKRRVIIPEPSATDSRKLTVIEFLNRHKWSFLPGTFFLLAFAQEDQFWLRSLCILGSVCGIAYHTSYTHVAKRGVIPAAFNMAYVILHLGFMYKIYLETRPVQLEPLQQMCHDQTFSGLLSKRDFKRFVDETGEFVNITRTETLDHKDHMYLVVQGQIGVYYGNFCVARSEKGFLGEMGYLQSHMGIKLIKSYNDARQKGLIRLIALEDTTALKVEKSKLKELLDAEPTIKSGMLSVWAMQHMKLLQTQAIERYVLVSGDYDLLLECLLDPRTVTNDDLKVLKKYRTYHDINDEAHVNSLKQLGWSVERLDDFIKTNEEKLARGEELIS